MTKQSGRKRRDALGKNARLSPKLTACVNAVLTRRFVEAQTVPMLLKSLAEDGIQTSESKLQEFIRRVLSVVGREQAVRIGINTELLKVVRRRLGLPLEPRGRKTGRLKARKRFDPRNRHRRRITLEPKAKRPAPLMTRPQKVGDRLKDQPLVTGTLLEPTAEEVSAFHRLHRTQIAEINREAVRKIRAVNRDMITNDRGRSYNLRTRDDYTPEDLQQKFGLTYAEAQSCFLTID